jgi:quinol monooxygenase YgiN
VILVAGRARREEGCLRYEVAIHGVAATEPFA